LPPYAVPRDLNVLDELPHTSSGKVDRRRLSSSYLDSIGVMKLAGHLESECDITIPAQDIILENFSTLKQIHSYLADRTAS